MIEEVKQLPQHFISKSINTTNGKAILKANLDGTIQVSWDSETDLEYLEIIPAEINASKKKTVFQNVFGFTNADINDKGVVLASPGGASKVDDYDVSEDEELDGEYRKRVEGGDGADFGNYAELFKANEDKGKGKVDFDSESESDGEGQVKDSKKRFSKRFAKISPGKQAIREAKVSSLKEKFMHRPDFYDPKTKHLAKIYFQCFNPATSFSRTLPADEKLVDVSLSDRVVNVLTEKFIRSYSFSGHLLSMIAINSCPLGLASIQGYVAYVYRDGLPVQGGQGLAVSIYDIYQSRRIFYSEVSVSPESELEFVGFDERGCLYVKDSKEAVRVLVGEGVWLPIFETVKSGETEIINSQRKNKYERSKHSIYFRNVSIFIIIYKLNLF